MTDAPDDPIDPLDHLAQEFLGRRRAGERIAVDAFAAQHPEHAAMLRDLLPTLLALEAAKEEKQSSTGGRRQPVLPQLDRLGDFRILRELGRGGMGVVFEAVQESLDRRVALKVLPQAALLTERQLSRFRREAHIAAQLHHSNIVPVFGSGESDGFHWYAMQFIAGQSLDQWRQAEGAAPPVGSGAWRSRARFVARLGQQAAQALHHAHGHGTLHRDIKPANLLLDRDDNVWVTDFGLAKALEEEGLTHSGDLLGTLQYMAPEQFTGQYDVRSEVYALGISLYELLALRPAYAAKTRSELLECIRTQSPADLRRLCPELPEDLVLVVEHAIARDPADRYADAAAFARDLQAFLEDRPIAARRQSSFGLLLRWCRRNRAMAALAAATLVAVLGAAIAGWTAYVIADDALRRVQSSAQKAQKESDLREQTLRLALSAFGNTFDALVGRDQVLALDEDPDTGEAILLTPSVRAQDVPLLETILRFYDEFAALNEDNQLLRLDTARAYRRVGAIQARFGEHDAAAAAYAQSLDRYRYVTERDVTREIAATEVEVGRLELLRGRGRVAEAVQRFRRALQMLEGEQLGDGKAVRFERAEVHFLLARAIEFWRPGGRGPGDGRERMAAAREHLDSARELLRALLGEDPNNPEFRAMQARLLCLDGRVRFRGAGDPAARQRDLDAGLQIYRELIARFPDNEDFRLELCSELTPELPRLLRGGSPDEQEKLLGRLLEAKEHAGLLVAKQPDYVEYQALAASISAGLGVVLRARSRNETGETRATTQREAIAELRAALERSPAKAVSTAQGGRGSQVMRDLMLVRPWLTELLVDQGDLTAARVEFGKLLDAIEAELASAHASPGGPGRGGPRGGIDPRIVWNVLPRMLERLSNTELQTRLEAIKQRVPAPSPRDDRGDERPGDRPGERPGEPSRRR